MINQDVPTTADGPNELGWDAGEVLDIEPVVADPIDAEAGVIVALDEDLDDIDVPIDPDFSEPWEVEDLDSNLDEPDEEEDEDFNDDAEIRLLHELGIDLDAPDILADDLDLVIDLDQDDAIDDGLAA
jgi:hypothetical protein